MSDEIKKVIEDIRDRTEKLGLYLRDVKVGAVDSSEEEDDDPMKEMPHSDELKKKLQDGDINVIVFTHFTLNELAFSDRIQNPGKVEEDDKFVLAAPTEFDILKDKMKRNIEAGRNPFDDGDES